MSDYNVSGGELTALLDGRVMAQKFLLCKPSVRKVLAAVRGRPDIR